MNNLNQEAFCQYFVNGDKRTFNNGKMSYAYAYKAIDKLEELEEKLKLEDNQAKRKEWSQEKLRLENVCISSASRMLVLVKVKERVSYLFGQLFNDANVDQELSKVIKQDFDLRSKVSAISEYNKLKKRAEDAGFKGQIVIKWDDGSTTSEE